MLEDHGAPEAGQLPGVWAKGRRETIAKERAAQESVAGLCLMR